MEKAEFVHLVEMILEKNQGSVSLEDSLVDIGWDSLAHLSLIAELDRRPNLLLALPEVSRARTVGDLYLAISSVV